MQTSLVLALTALAIAGCLVVALTPVPAESPSRKGGKDLEVYRHIVERVHSGESYYVAAGSELSAEGYPTNSIFNWRTPTYAWFFALFPSPRWGQGILLLLALGVLFAVRAVLEREAGSPTAWVGMLLMLCGLLWCVDGEAYLAQELWAGTLMTLSACAYLLGSWPVGLAAGLSALFFRELALPYCLIAAALAYRDDRRREVAAWSLGLTCYALFLGWHSLHVLQHMTAKDGGGSVGRWIQFGGLRFILATNRMNWFLFKAPDWVGALYLPLALLGLGSWKHGLLVLLTVVSYLVAFAIIGQSFNEYWGLFYVSLLAFGAAWTPVAVRDLWRVIRTRTV
jgi:hypothetical protein